jgi:hypothetical protein
MNSKCYRCNKNQCSQEYRADSTNPITSKAQKYLEITTSNAKKQRIKCCIKCISPASRDPLHKAEVFVKPENMFLNYIVDKLDRLITTEKSFNAVEITDRNPDKEDKYDLLISKGNKYMLVEVDESQHFKQKQFHEDRKREKRFWAKYGANQHVIRIRVGDDGKEKQYSCVSRSGGTSGGCRVTNNQMFAENMNSIVAHINKYFKNGNVVKHAYIEFFNSLGIQDFKKVFNYTPTVGKQPSSYEHIHRPNDLVENMAKLKINSPTPAAKMVKCKTRGCTTKTKNGICAKCK